MKTMLSTAKFIDQGKSKGFEISDLPASEDLEVKHPKYKLL